MWRSRLHVHSLKWLRKVLLNILDRTHWDTTTILLKMFLNCKKCTCIMLQHPFPEERHHNQAVQGSFCFPPNLAGTRGYHNLLRIRRKFGSSAQMVLLACFNQKPTNADEVWSTGVRVGEWSMNALEEVSIIKTVSSGGIDFNKLAAKGERSQMSL